MRGHERNDEIGVLSRALVADELAKHKHTIDARNLSTSVVGPVKGLYIFEDDSAGVCHQCCRADAHHPRRRGRSSS
jgi:hypothetical protein